MTVTVTQLRERIDEQVLAQLTDPDGVVVNEVKLRHALADAAGQIAGYTYTLPSADKPPAATLDAHQVALALYVLAGNRPGAEFDSIRSRAKVALEFLAELKDRPRITLDIATDAPSPQIGSADLDLFQGKDQ